MSYDYVVHRSYITVLREAGINDIMSASGNQETSLAAWPSPRLKDQGGWVTPVTGLYPDGPSTARDGLLVFRMGETV